MANVEPLSCSFPAQAENIVLARRAIDAFMNALGVPAHRREEIRLAVSEACANAVLHAYTSGRAGRFDVSAEGDGERLLVHVRDHGAGMRPNPDSPGMGMGLPIIGALADGFEIVPREPGTEIAMTFELGREEARPSTAAPRRHAHDRRG
jgi:anti-sigma regulatory factor (Ser/Thr protein kinase)